MQRICILNTDTTLATAGRMPLQLAGCAPGSNENVALFLRDFAREALAAFQF